MAVWKYRRSRYRGAAAWELESDDLSAVVLPDFGGKIASIRSAAGGKEPVELLYQPRSPHIVLPSPGARFSDAFSWGWDDMFPTVAPCIYALPPHPPSVLPDHGEIWSSPAEPILGTRSCAMIVRGRSLPYRMEKTLVPLSGGLRIEWTLENLSDESLIYLWAAHPLFAVEGDTFLVVPHGDIRLAYENPIGFAGRTLRRDGVERMPEGSGRGALKYFFLSPLTGRDLPIELHRPAAGIAIRMTFDIGVLRYLGVWLNAGGWEDQYTMALEGGTGLSDSLEEARENGSGRVLSPRDQERWWMELKVEST